MHNFKYITLTVLNLNPLNYIIHNENIWIYVFVMKLHDSKGLN